MAIASPRKQSVYHKRSRGQHHKQDHRYLKAYHPYLPLLLLVVISLGINMFLTNRPQVLGTQTSLSNQELLIDTNSQRLNGRASDLILDSKLSAAAQAKAEDMVNRNYWSHDTPDGRSPWSFVRDTGYSYQSAGENLAYGFSDSQDVITGWMNSPEHRDNVLNNDFNQVGFGIASSENYVGKGRSTVVVAMYGSSRTYSPGTISSSTAGNGQSGISTFATIQPARTVSRIELLSNGRAPWTFAALVVLTMAAAIIFVMRHAKAWHRLVVRGEAFVLRHKTFDLVVFSIVLLGVIMTRTAGFIG